MKKINTILIGTIIILFSFAGMAVFFVLYINGKSPVFKALYITFLTLFYHFAMRILVGESVTAILKNRRLNYNSKWFSEKKFEKKLYKLLKVRKWAPKIMTAKPEQFDIRKRSPEELLFYMTQAEIVHESSMALSFLPLLLIIPYGAPATFISTSLLACFADIPFVIVQRYNRPKVIKYLRRKGKR